MSEAASAGAGARMASGGGTRVHEPDREGYVEREGIRVFYEVHGDGEPAILLCPTWSLVDSRVWKMQVPYLARHHRVVVFDPRGNGASDRPPTREQYAESEFAQDALDVMDATGTERAVIVGLSRGAQRALLLASEHPERVLGVVFVAPWFPASSLGGLRYRLAANSLMRRLMAVVLSRQPDRVRPEGRASSLMKPKGWAKFNAIHIHRDYLDFVEWFATACTDEPHTSRAFDDVCEWAEETDGGAISLTAIADAATPLSRRAQIAIAQRLCCPVLVIGGSRDRITSFADAEVLADATGGRLLTIGECHVPEARHPVEVNHAIREFVDPSFRHEPTPRRLKGGQRALFVSSPIGLGHVRRDVAIAAELRKLVPDLEIDWLAQDPVTRVLGAEGERIHPASRYLASESAHFEAESGEHDLHCFEAFRRMDEILGANFMVFDDVVRERQYDLWIGDEAWELDYHLHENPRLKRAPFAWLTDFVGWLPMDDDDDRRRSLVADYNAEMIEHVRDQPQIRDRAILIGEPEDLVEERLGPGLPGIREWTESNFEFVPYITGFDPADLPGREDLRQTLGFGPDERVCVVTVGGSGIGTPLLTKASAAYPTAKGRVPELRMIVVAGPRIDPTALPTADGLEVRPYVHDLYRHLAACDLAVVQGGLTTTMELTASRTPFIYFPLGHHCEQQFHVRYRLERYGAGRPMDFDETSPEMLGEAIAEDVRRGVGYRPIANVGARRAAERIAELLPT